MQPKSLKRLDAPSAADATARLDAVVKDVLESNDSGGGEIPVVVPEQNSELRVRIHRGWI